MIYDEPIETVPLSALREVARLDGADVKELREVASQMLEALKEIADDLRQCNGGKGPQLPISVKILEQAEAAIKKAREIL